ncbi:choline kinase [Photobacterium sanctipauli]|uniref:Choline kinase n=1 Tax=Photobacterium sanctipauli TaxID=1342794 RepID=A0A2T3NIC5_9GAMM|nr:phosphotransferase [Photobacterium sanctipauli]PSW14730.1 choline kinase [Photobacterium sanctipauli]
MVKEELSQMGSASVYLTEYQGVECIRKLGASPIELSFYQHSAPLLRQAGVNIPDLIHADGTDLYIEFIPNPIALNELNQTDDVYRQISIIHSLNLESPPYLKTHEWSLAKTHSAFQILNLPSASQAVLTHIQTQSRCLFSPATLISGDTNDGNWGRRNTGELVLFDWERFGYGSPAIDLAPLVKGMGCRADYESVIERYLKHSTAQSAGELLRQLVMAKAWIVIDVVNLLVERNNPMKGKYIDWFNENLPYWLDETAVASV